MHHTHKTHNLTPTYSSLPAGFLENYGCQMDPSTSVRSPYEQAVKECLLESGITTYYEPFLLRIESFHKSERFYLPDFVTELEVDGRRVIIEPHPMSLLPDDVVSRDTSKFKGFENDYHDSTYFVLVSDLSTPDMEQRTNTPVDKLASEYWPIPSIIRGDTNGHSISSVKTIVQGNLAELMRKAS